MLQRTEVANELGCDYIIQVILKKNIYLFIHLFIYAAPRRSCGMRDL